MRNGNRIENVFFLMRGSMWGDYTYVKWKAIACIGSLLSACVLMLRVRCVEVQNWL